METYILNGTMHKDDVYVIDTKTKIEIARNGEYTEYNSSYVPIREGTFLEKDDRSYVESKLLEVARNNIISLNNREFIDDFVKKCNKEISNFINVA